MERVSSLKNGVISIDFSDNKSCILIKQDQEGIHYVYLSEKFINSLFKLLTGMSVSIVEAFNRNHVPANQVFTIHDEKDSLDGFVMATLNLCKSDKMMDYILTFYSSNHTLVLPKGTVVELFNKWSNMYEKDESYDMYEKISPIDKYPAKVNNLHDFYIMIRNYGADENGNLEPINPFDIDSATHVDNLPFVPEEWAMDDVLYVMNGKVYVHNSTDGYFVTNDVIDANGHNLLTKYANSIIISKGEVLQVSDGLIKKATKSAYHIIASNIRNADDPEYTVGDIYAVENNDKKNFYMAKSPTKLRRVNFVVENDNIHENDIVMNNTHFYYKDEKYYWLDHDECKEVVDKKMYTVEKLPPEFKSLSKYIDDVNAVYILPNKTKWKYNTEIRKWEELT